MILIDSSVWIDYFAGRPTPETNDLDRLWDTGEVYAGDLIVAEVLQGFRRDADFELALQILLGFGPVPMVSARLAAQSARNYRALRGQGFTLKTIDCLIATFCMEEGFELLHSDRHFDVFEEHLGLRVRRAPAGG